MQQRYFLSKQFNMSYLDTGEISPKELEILFNLSMEEKQKRENK